jgi:hypothetical protein
VQVPLATACIFACVAELVLQARVVDVIMHRQNHCLALSFWGLELGGNDHDPVLELGNVAALSALVGFGGTIVLWLVNALCIWAEKSTMPARQADRREWLSCIVWHNAHGLSLRGPSMRRKKGLVPAQPETTT